jgi:hypothetical protein
LIFWSLLEGHEKLESITYKEKIMFRNKSKWLFALLPIIILSFFLTGFNTFKMELISTEYGQIGQDPTPPAPQEPVEPAPEQPAPEQPEGSNPVIIQIPGVEDSTLGILLLVVIGMLIGRGSKSKQGPPPTPSDDQTAQY